MSTRRTPWPLGMPCWVDLIAPDVETALSFYGEVVGWEFPAVDEQFGRYRNAETGVCTEPPARFAVRDPFDALFHIVENTGHPCPIARHQRDRDSSAKPCRPASSSEAPPPSGTRPDQAPNT